MSNDENPTEPEIVDSLPEELLKQGVSPDTVQKIKLSISQMWSGPLPPPEIFNKYPEEVQKAIVSQATGQIKHRQKLESKVVDSNISNSKKGMNYAFIITLALIAAGVGLIALGKSAAGLIAIFGPSAFHGSNFLIQKWQEWRKIGRDMAEDNNKAVSKVDHD